MARTARTVITNGVPQLPSSQSSLFPETLSVIEILEEVNRLIEEVDNAKGRLETIKNSLLCMSVTDQKYVVSFVDAKIVHTGLNLTLKL